MNGPFLEVHVFGPEHVDYPESELTRRCTSYSRTDIYIIPPAVHLQQHENIVKAVL
jgi:hypothetical protein